jgi:hypothetical protein
MIINKNKLISTFSINSIKIKSINFQNKIIKLKGFIILLYLFRIVFYYYIFFLKRKKYLLNFIISKILKFIFFKLILNFLLINYKQYLKYFIHNKNF